MELFRQCALRENKSYAIKEKVNAKIRLDLSINPLGPPPTVKRFLEKLDFSNIQRYPEPCQLPELKREAADFFGVNTEDIMITSGADQAIEVALSHLLNPGDKIAIQNPTFPRFEIVAKNLCDAFTIDFTNQIPESKVVVLCTPNNPTTQEISRETIITILENNPDKMIIIDNVFGSFGKEKIDDLVNKFGNLIILKSLSKDFGLAGMRIGFILSKQENIGILENGIAPFRVPTFIQNIATEALKDRNHLEKTKGFLKGEIGFIKSELGDLVIQETVLPFFLFKSKTKSVDLKKKLLDMGISIVDGSSFKGLDENLSRIAIGKHEDNVEFIKAAEKIYRIGHSL